LPAPLSFAEKHRFEVFCHTCRLSRVIASHGEYSSVSRSHDVGRALPAVPNVDPKGEMRLFLHGRDDRDQAAARADASNQDLIPTQFCANLSKSSVCCVSSVMASEVEFWRQDAATKAEGIARDVERLSRQARAAGLSVTAYILGLAVEEARKEAGAEDGKVQHASSSWRHGVRT
jgi:hypothetical protein